MKIKNKLALLSALALSFVMTSQTAINAFAQTFNSGISADGKYYTDFASPEEAKAAAEELSAEMANEGTVLLKNDGALPVSVKDRVSVFGGSQDNILVTAGATTSQSGDRSVVDALKAHGFEVNPILDKHYKSTGNSIGTESTDFSRTVEQSYDLYKDLAIVTVSRTSSEGRDGSRNTGEVDEGWEHNAAVTDEEGNAYKHYLQLTDDEQALIEYVKAQGFEKVVVVINSALRLELSDLEKDEDINGIIWMGMPGANGIHALPKILDGTVNPSGKTVDIWYKDFTADPTWYNFGDNSQTDSSYQYKNEAGENVSIYGVDYEEDIYIGYKYYETRAYEASKEGSTDTFNYDDAVVYPFGYGLSYTSFSYDNMNIVMDNGDKMEGTLSAALFASSVGNEAEVEKATATVTVTNTGKLAGKEAVQLYVTAPYTAGGIEKSYVSLVGFAKTDLLQPGQSQKLKIEFNIQDMASYDYNNANGVGDNGYELDEGDYVVRAMSSSHGWAENGADYQEVNFKLDNLANLDLDDYSGNEIENLFSEENGIFNSLRTNATEGYEVNVDKTATTKLLSRTDLSKLPEAPTTADLTLTAEFIESNTYWNGFRMSNGYNDKNDADHPWMADVEEAFKEGGRATDWDQTGKYGYKVSDMSGIDPDDTVNKIVGGKFDGLTGQQAWDKFINSLAFEDVIAIVGNNDGDVNAEAFDWHASAGSDSTTNLSKTHQWPAQPTVAATWNVELLNREGIIVANMAMMKGVWEWWGPGIQVHRSPFGGRTHEYYAEDGYLAGAMAAALTAGVTSRGLGISIKHFGFNDQETGRTSNGGTMTWVSEQAIREYYMKPFQMALQEGGSTNAMAAYGRIGRVAGIGNYNFLTALTRKEWGFRGSICTDNYSLIGSFVTNDLEIRGGANGSCTDDPSGTWNAEKKTVTIGYVDLPVFSETTAYAVGDKVQRTAREGRQNVTRYYEFTVVHEAGAWNAEQVTELQRAAVEKTFESKAQWYLLRQATIRSLYIIANTTRNYNGLDWSVMDKYATVTVPTLKAGTAMEAVDLSVDTAVLGTNVVKYSASGLPAGLSINEETGILSGTPAEAGDFNVTVNVNADGWLNKTAKLSLTVDPTMIVKAGEAISLEVNIFEVGENLPANTNYGQMNIPAESVNVNISGLPASLTIENDVMSGSINEVGMYSIVIDQSAYCSAYGGVVAGTAESHIAIVIKVEAGEVVPTKDIVNVETIEGGYKITFSDETSIEIMHGTNGTNGTNGTDGMTPTVEISDDGYWVINGEKTEVKAAGEKGDKGDKGDTGATGTQGPQGEKGETGAAGADGKDAESPLAALGCSGSIAGTAIVSMLAMATILVLNKKRED